MYYPLHALPSLNITLFQTKRLIIGSAEGHRKRDTSFDTPQGKMITQDSPPKTFEFISENDGIPKANILVGTNVHRHCKVKKMASRFNLIDNIYRKWN